LLVQDVWPDSIFSSGFLTGRSRPGIEAVLRRLVSTTYRHAEHIAVISPGMVDLLAARGVPRHKLSVVYNWVDEPSSPLEHVDPRGQWGVARDDFVLMYAGNHGAAQGLDAAIEAVGMLDRDDRCHLVLVGDGVEKPRLRALAKRVAPDRVHFIEPVPRAAMPALMSAANAQLVSLADRPLFRVTMPSKLQSAMASGHPVLAAVGGDVRKVVQEAGAGVTAEPQDPRSIADALLILRSKTSAQLHEMGNRGRDYYGIHMARDVGGKRLAQILETAAKGTRS
jgi:glycosyltransferase involved in cell wall biosynthesis